MKNMNYAMILFFLTKISIAHGESVFESFVYQETPTQIDDIFQKAIDSSTSLDKQENSGFVPFKANLKSVGNLDTKFEAVSPEKKIQVSPDFENTGPEVEDRVLTDAQKNSQKIFEERLKEDNRKQKILMALQEQEYLEMRQKVWKAFEEKVDRVGEKRDFSPVKRQKARQAQSLLEQLQALKSALLEKDKLASDLADKLSKINTQRIIAAQPLQMQKITKRSLSGAVNIKTKSGNAQLMQERNQEQINAESFLLLDKQFNIVNSQLQNVRNEAQKIRGQFQEIQQTIEEQLPKFSGKEEAY